MAIVLAGVDKFGARLRGELHELAAGRAADLRLLLREHAPQDSHYALANFNLSGNVPDTSMLPDPVVDVKIRSLRKSDRRRKSHRKLARPSEPKEKSDKQKRVLNEVRARQTEARRKIYEPIARRREAEAYAKAKAMLDGGQTRLTLRCGVPYMWIANHRGRSAGWWSRFLRAAGV